MATTEQTFVEKRSGDTLVNALIGAAVAFVVGMVLPFVSFVLGGFVSGYLQAGPNGDGAKVGTLSALIASLPAIGIFGLVGLFFLGIDPAGFAFIIVLFAVLFAISVGLGAVGGFLGAVVADD